MPAERVPLTVVPAAGTLDSLVSLPVTSASPLTVLPPDARDGRRIEQSDATGACAMTSCPADASGIAR